MDSEKLIKLIEKFLGNLKVDHICNFWVESNKEEGDPDLVWIYVVIDQSFIEMNLRFREPIVRGVSNRIKNKVMNVFGLESEQVHIATIIRPCYE